MARLNVHDDADDDHDVKPNNANIILQIVLVPFLHFVGEFALPKQSLQSAQG